MPFRRIILRLVLVIVTLVAIIVALAPLEAWARAGGGGGYGGGGGGGGGGFGGGGYGGGGSSGGGGDITYLFVRYPAVAIPVTILLIVAFIYMSYKGKTGYEGHTIRRGVAAMDHNRRAAAVLALQARDPGFDEDLFYQRVEAAFIKIQQAWSNQDLQTVRPFTSDGIHERFSLQFDEQRDFGYRNEMQRVAVQSVVLAHVESDAVFDEVTVRIDASAVDYRVSLQSGRRISGSNSPEPFTEYWSFLRRGGAQTHVDRPGLIEGNCPNCGSAIEMNQSGNCIHCNALLRSAQHDWVLVEITQASEWRPGHAGNVPGAADLREDDPQFSIQHLEDRASVLFWRKAMADREGDIRPLRKMASNDFADRYARGLGKRDGRAFYGDCAVGSVDTLGILRGDEFDQALVEVRWAGTRHVIKGGKPDPTPHKAWHQTLLVLQRRQDARSDAGQGISSAHCPTCGAPESAATSNACDFCGEILNDGRREWVLSELLPRNSTQAQELMGQLRDLPLTPITDVAGAPAETNGQATPSARGLMAWMINVMLADGHVNDDERKVVRHAASRRRIPAPDVEEMIASATRGELEPPHPADADEARQWLESMVGIAMANGSISREEKTILHAVAQRTGLGAADLRLMVNRQRGKLYRLAKTELKTRRG